VSVGLGIFLSSLALIAAWQIGKFKAWRKAGKIAAWVGGALIVLGAIAYGYFWWNGKKGERAERDEIAAVRAGKITSYWGLPLGVSQNEVIYRKGQPDEKQGASEKAVAYWVFNDGNNVTGHHYILWDEHGLAQTISCENASAIECDPIAGVYLEMTEEDVRSRLGAPVNEEWANVQGTKILSYGTTGARVDFWMSLGKVHTITLTNISRDGKSLAQQRAE
jgi:hypothetical protein